MDSGDPHSKPRKRSKRSKKGAQKETRENRFGPPGSYPKYSIDRRNEININPESTADLVAQDPHLGQNLQSDVPTDSMIVTAIDRKTLGYGGDRGMEAKFSQPPGEESSYAKEVVPRINLNGNLQGYEGRGDDRNGPEEYGSQKNLHKYLNPISHELAAHQKRWEVKPTSKGFIYFKRKNQTECQWDVPRAYDAEKRKYKPIFNYQWKKIKNSQTGAKFWKNLETEMTQTADPFGKTYIFEAAMESNIAFLELYCQYGGNINLFDHKKRTPLHYA